MRKRFNRDDEVLVESIGRKALAAIDEILKAHCPQCGLTGLGVAPESGHLVISCLAPHPYDSERESSTCGYETFIYKTDTRAMPKPVFAEYAVVAERMKKKPPVRRRKVTRR